MKNHLNGSFTFRMSVVTLWCPWMFVRPASLHPRVLPFIPPCCSHSSQTSTRARWEWRPSAGRGRWLRGKQWAGNGSDLQTRSAWSAPLPSCLGSAAQESLERLRSRLIKRWSQRGAQWKTVSLWTLNSPCQQAWLHGGNTSNVTHSRRTQQWKDTVVYVDGIRPSWQTLFKRFVGAV